MVDGIEIRGTRDQITLLKAAIEQRRQEAEEAQAALKGTQQLYQEAISSFLGIKGRQLAVASESILQQADNYQVDPHQLAVSLSEQISQAHYLPHDHQQLKKNPGDATSPDEAFQVAVEIIREEEIKYPYRTLAPFVNLALSKAMELAVSEGQQDTKAVYGWLLDHDEWLWRKRNPYHEH